MITFRRIIPKGEYCSRIEQGIPIGNCWVDMGNGILAFALQNANAISVPFTKFKDRTFILSNVCALYCPRLEQKLEETCENVGQRKGGVYRFDKKTGEFTLFKETDKEFDSIGKFKYDKKKDEWVLKTNRKKEAKTVIDQIERGILKDGINFQEKNNLIAIGGEGQPTETDLEAFILQLSDMVGKEIGGAYFSKDGTGSTTHMSIGLYKNNTYKKSVSSGQSTWSRQFPDSKIEISITGFFHTHPSGGNISIADRISGSEQDLRTKVAILKNAPNLQFFILTNPIYYGGTNKFRY